MKIESKIGKSGHSARQIYTFASNFHNFKDLLPADRVSGWEASEDRCSFNVDPLGRTGLMIIEKEAFKLIKMASDPEFSSYQFTIWIQLKQVAEEDTRIKITVEPQVNSMLLPMIKGPLKKFANGLIDKIESFDFSD
ncbi:MAG: SRPBCC family protein [Bacteroidota bacterium]